MLIESEINIKFSKFIIFDIILWVPLVSANLNIYISRNTRFLSTQLYSEIANNKPINFSQSLTSVLHI